MPEIMSLSGNNPYLLKKMGDKKTKQTAVPSKTTEQPQFAGAASKGKNRRALEQDSFQVNAKRRKLAAREESPSSESDTGDEAAEVMLLNDPNIMNAFLMMGGNPPGGPVGRPGGKPANLTDHIKPLQEDAPDLDAYKEAGAPFADKLSEITSRAYLHNAVLKSDNEQMKKGILMKLKEKLGQQPIFSVDCAPEKIAGLKRDEQGGVLTQAFSEPADKLGLPKDKPTVLVLNNAPNSELDHLKRMDAYQRIKDQNPHFRFIINDATAKESGSAEDNLKAAVIKSIFGGKESASSAEPAPFEVLEVPSVNARQWHGIIQKDKQAQYILKHWKLNFPQDTFKEFLEALQRQSQAPLTHHQILSELDALGSFIRVRKQDASSEVKKQHINQFSREVVNARKKPDKLDSNSPASMMPKPYTIINSSDIKTKLEDVVGHDDAKAILTQALEAVKYPTLYEYLDEGDEDAQNNNVLLLGEPGGGKTMLARAIAGQGKGTFISSTGSQFVNMIVGMGANNVRRLKAAIEEAPDDMVVVFIDEIDTLGSRGGEAGSGSKDMNGLAANREETQTINEFLAFTEGVSQGNKKVLLIGATNRPFALDDAILSRFHHKLEIQKLNPEQRKEVLEKQMAQKKLKADPSVDLEQMAKLTEGFRGRDLRNLMKLAKQEIIRRIPRQEKERLEHDAQARSRFELKLTNEILQKALHDVKEGIKNASGKKEESPPPEGLYL